MIHPLDLTGYSKAEQWCGPSALSLITGAPLAETTKRFAYMQGEAYQKLSGVYAEELLLALWEQGWKAENVGLLDRYPKLQMGPTLARYMRERPKIEVINKLLINVTGHFIVAHGRYLFDNWVPRGATIDTFPKPRRHVQHVWIVTHR